MPYVHVDRAIRQFWKRSALIIAVNSGHVKQHLITVI